MADIERWECPEHGAVPSASRSCARREFPDGNPCGKAMMKAEYVRVGLHQEAVSLIQDVARNTGAKVRGDDARSMARRASEWLEKHGYPTTPGGR